MIRIKLLSFILFLISMTAVAQDDVLSAFILKWENSKAYLLEIAEAMPEEAYDFSPTEREMTFKKQLLHIRENILWLAETYFADRSDTKPDKIDPLTKELTIKELELAFDKVIILVKNMKNEDLKNEVKFFAGPKTNLQILNLLQDHVTHHRGQLIVYLNLNGIQPPKYRGW